MDRIAGHCHNRLTSGLTAFWGSLFVVDGLLRWLPPTMIGPLHGYGADILPHAVRIFSGLNWPLAKIGLMEPFVGAWEITIAMFLLAALYEMATGDSADILPGSAMLILGLAMALTSLAIVFVAAVQAHCAGPVAMALWPMAGGLALSLVAAVAERLDAEKLLRWELARQDSVPMFPFGRR
ncbi:hypothetical protein [Phreatobacter stygius]|uniref:Uncharacterized protein n=1 Tax=Phreatobacter stygius TaxID=1940610 RepID=A0A4D7APE8_9HYPH|nr:hypothetical protein [Phreatobacter stygius]QCI62859.1 hypothetical protein E8M01_00520 [Phreatobacter stygius]